MPSSSGEDVEQPVGHGVGLPDREAAVRRNLARGQARAQLVRRASGGETGRLRQPRKPPGRHRMGQGDRGARRRTVEGKPGQSCAMPRPGNSGSAAAAPRGESVMRRKTEKDRVMSSGPLEASAAGIWCSAGRAGWREGQAVALGRLRMNATAPVMASAWKAMRTGPKASATLMASAAPIMARARAL